MTLVYASDANYVALTAISAVSALTHNPGAEIVLLGYGLEAAARELVQSRVEAKGGSFRYVEVGGALENLKARGYNGYTSYATYARIFIPELLAQKRVIYLDCDTLVGGSLKELWEQDLGGKPLALATDCVPWTYKRAINHPKELPYYNAGVMVIDLEAWREHRCTERFLDELAHPHGPNPLGDQDVFVRLFPEETALLHPKWNFISHYFLFSYAGVRRVNGGVMRFGETEYEEAQKDPRIFHFLGHTLGRPWYTSSRHPLRERYRVAAREADLALAAEQTRPMQPCYLLQYYLHKFLPQGAFDLACYFLYLLNIRLNYGC